MNYLHGVETSTPIDITVALAALNDAIGDRPLADCMRLPEGISRGSVAMSGADRQRLLGYVEAFKPKKSEASLLTSVRLSDAKGLRLTIEEVMPRDTLRRHGGGDLRILARWAEAELARMMLPEWEREGYLVIHQMHVPGAGPGTWVVLMRDVDEWRLVRIDRVKIPEWAVETKKVVCLQDLDAAEARRKAPDPKRRPLSGNTYPVRHHIKMAGGRWLGGEWHVPIDAYDRLAAMIAALPSSRWRQ